MNELSTVFLGVNDGDTIILEKNKIYDVRQDDSFEFEGYYCSNTAKQHENPNGLRRAALFLKNKKDVVIDGNGATVLVHGKMTPFLFDRCENITVKNLTVDYACPTMSEFTVLSNKNGVCDIAINKECLFRVEGNEIIWHGECGLIGEPYWEDSHVGNRRHFKILNPKTKKCSDFRRDDLTLEKIEQIDSSVLRIHLVKKDAPLYEGYIMQTRNIIRDQTGALFQRCKNLSFESLRIKFMHGLGMVSQFCENICYKNCDFTPAEGRTIASTADFFQFSGCRGKIIIENCKAFGAQDDYVNVHGTHLQIIDKNSSENSITVRFMHNESWGFQAFEKGDELEFIKWDTLIPYSQTVVESYERLSDTDIKLYLDRALPDIELCRDVVENATWTPDLYVSGCDFGPTSGRGILCTTRGEVIIENNRFHNLWGPALLIEDDCNFWFESGCTKEIIFRNNTVDTCDYASTAEHSPVIRYTPKVMNEKSEEYVHGKLVVTGNKFYNSAENAHAIMLNYLREAEIYGNVFDAPYHIYTHHTGEIADYNNTVSGGTL